MVNILIIGMLCRLIFLVIFNDLSVVICFVVVGFLFLNVIIICCSFSGEVVSVLVNVLLKVFVFIMFVGRV